MLLIHTHVHVLFAIFFKNFGNKCLLYVNLPFIIGTWDEESAIFNTFTCLLDYKIFYITKQVLKKKKWVDNE